MFAVTICLAAKVFDFTDDLLIYSVLLDFSVVSIKRTDTGQCTSTTRACSLNPKRCGLFGQLRRRGGGLKVPTERYWSLDTPILVLIKEILFHMKAGISS